MKKKINTKNKKISGRPKQDKETLARKTKDNMSLLCTTEKEGGKSKHYISGNNKSMDTQFLNRNHGSQRTIE